MTREQKIEMLDYLARQIRKIDQDSLKVKEEFDKAVSIMDKVEGISKLKYLEGRLNAYTEMVKDLGIDSKFHEETFSLN